MLDIATLKISGAKATADVAEILTSLRMDAQTGAVAQLSLTVSDADAALMASSTLAEGSTLTWRGKTWEVAAVSTRLGDDGTLAHTFDARSPLARKLRAEVKTSIRQQISPSNWVQTRVKAAGGKAICQPSNVRSAIGQRGKTRTQSTLDVIANLASDLGWSWVDRDGVLVFGSAHWAWQGKLSIAKTWALDWDADAILDADMSLDADDREAIGTGQLSLAYDAAADMNVWDRIVLTGAGRYSGDWLIDSVQIEADPSKPIVIDITQPLKPAPQKARTT